RWPSRRSAIGCGALQRCCRVARRSCLSAGRPPGEDAAMSDIDIDFYESEDPIWNPALLAIPMPGIRKMVNLASTMDDVIHLSIGQPDLLAPRHVVDATVAALHAGQTGYTMDAGLPELLDALAEYYGERYQRSLS